MSASACNHSVPGIFCSNNKNNRFTAIIHIFAFSALTLLVGWPEGHLGDGGGRHWLVHMEWRQPDGQCACLY